MLGIGLALISAATFGLNAATLRRGVVKGSVFQALAITTPLGVPLFALAVTFGGAWSVLGEFSNTAIGYFAIAGVIHFVVGRYGNYRATKALGANPAGPVLQTSILISLVIGLGFLGETLTVTRSIGVVLVILGPTAMMYGKAVPIPGFVPNYRDGIVYGLLCAVCYGSSPLFIKWGLEELAKDTVLQGALVAGLVSYFVAAACVGLVVLWPARRRDLSTLERGPSAWFVATGVLVFASQMFRYLALAIAPVTVVVPIQRLAVVFRVLFSWVLNREHEEFSLRVYAGIAFSLAGALLLSLSL